MAGGAVRGALVVAVGLAAASCAVGGDPTVSAEPAAAGPALAAVTSVAPTIAPPASVAAPTTALSAVAPAAVAPTTTASTVATSTTAAPSTTSTTEAPRPGPRVVTETGFSPYGSVGGLTLVHPANRVERVGFHESNHDGARQQEPVATAVAPVTMETRERGTPPRGSADIVVDPAGEIRSPVTGTVKRGGTYTLYCDHRDDFVVIAPDANPAWEVKVLHISGLAVRRGERVVAGETVIAGRATQLPFESQVDELRTADPAWPHVHVEVVDPSIPDRPSKGGGGC